MADEWMIRGVQYGNCSCNYGCPCQFHAPTTHGYCEAAVGGRVDEGHFNGTRLDGLTWAMLMHFPGEVAEGNGKQQVIIDERADPNQREALRKILHGESTRPGATAFYVYNSLMLQVYDPLYLPIDFDADVEARKGHIKVPGVVDSLGTPIKDPFSDEDFRARIQLPNGFEYTVAEMGSGTTKATGSIELDLSDSYGQFHVVHMNQDGVIR